ncbi:MULTISPECIES: pilus assembly protein TadG-related protein [unclassified Burkholderia]|uniref:pilus assembly protein TadG-related protein n=1 Tax=unclassified Burkholderia TaxID=2613784 RepID=UPI00226C3DB6|nr:MULTISPECIES: TadG family pilus assembly protein [unclassified Burkholderia]UEP31868.1 pilus assembly protein TadG-related protein [Burkholderia sp. B21-007]UEP45544.1 pilus assembly protein TadG-related protein [Burkholderia sp. B21-005]
MERTEDLARRALVQDKSRGTCERERGSIVLFFLLFLIPLLMFGALAIDVAWVATVRNQLQNAADAAALAGASALTSSGATTLNWSQASTAAHNAVALNSAAGTRLSTGTVTAGYWNLTRSPYGMQATTIAPGTYDAPGVQVTVSRTTNVNGGNIPLLLGNLLGIPSTSGSATAVAVLTSPGSIGAGGVFLVALDQCIYNQYWNSAINQPLINPLTNLPYEIFITNGQTYGSSCSAGTWTSFLTNANDVPTISGLMQTGNPTQLSVGDEIYLDSGSKAALYSSVPVGATVVLPVVTQSSSKSYVSIVAFAAFAIDASVGGSDKYIMGHFVTGYKVRATVSGVGPYYGVYSSPKLAL